MKVCPQCAERVQDAAKVCRFCGHKFPEPDTLPGNRNVQLVGVSALVLVVLGLIAWTGNPQSVAAPAADTTPKFTADQMDARKNGCDDSIRMAHKIGLIRSQPTALRIDVDEALWKLMTWNQKLILLDCLAVSAAGGAEPGDQVVSAYGVHSGKELAGGSPGGGTLSPSD